MSALLCALIGCSARQGLEISVVPTPAWHAWWLRSTFNATGREVRGIPVARLGPGWCNANVFSLDAFPPEVRSGDRGLDAMLAADAGAFSMRGTYGERPLEIMLGVYRTCAGAAGDFLLVLDATRSAREPQRIVQLEVLSTRPAFLYLMPTSTPEAIRIVSCFQCDHMGEWRWDPARARFSAVPDPEFD